MKLNGLHIALIFTLSFTSCGSDDDNNDYVNQPTPAPLDIPQIFSDYILDPVIPIDNPQTVEGIALGKKLFFDPILSANNTQSCASCHRPQNAFSDLPRFSVGIDGIPGDRNSMPIFNLAWNYDDRFFGTDVLLVWNIKL